MNNKTSVLIVTGLFPPDIGGPATYSKILQEELPKNGLETKVLSFGQVRWLPVGIRHLYFLFLVCRDILFYKIIYVQDPVSVGLPTMIACRIFNKPFILKVVGDYAWEQGMQRFGLDINLDQFVKLNKGLSWQVKGLKKIQSMVAKNAHLVITPSDYLKNILITWGVETEKIKVIYNSFELPVFDQNKTELRSEFGWDFPVITSVGRLVPWKGFDLLIETLNEVDNKIKLYIIGDGPDRKKLEDLVAKLNLKDRVFFTGRLDKVSLFKYLKASDLFVLNTSYEGFSHQLLEVMALEIPVITTNVGGNKELITDQQTGFLIDYNNKEALIKTINLVLNDKELVKKITKQAKLKVSYFTKDRMIKDLINVFYENN